MQTAKRTERANDQGEDEKQKKRKIACARRCKEKPSFLFGSGLWLCCGLFPPPGSFFPPPPSSQFFFKSHTHSLFVPSRLSSLMKGRPGPPPR